MVWQAHPVLHTAFVALQPISRDLGPTRFIPHTHTDQEAHAAHVAHGDATILRSGSQGGSPMPSQVGLLDTGDVALYDARLFHCGSANTHGTAAARDNAAGGGGSAPEDGYRVLFYLTTRHAARLADATVHDPARSLLSHLDGGYTLGMLRDGCFEADEARQMLRSMQKLMSTT